MRRLQCTKQFNASLDEYDASDGGSDVDEDVLASEYCVTGTERSSANDSAKRFTDIAKKLQLEA